MSAFTLGDRYDWRGQKHGPWYRDAGALKMRPTRKLPLRDRYTGRNTLEAVRAFVRLLTEDPIAAAVVCGGVPVTALTEMDAEPAYVRAA